ncbi:Meiotically protein [Penicillium canariense]|uniref:Meiotically protein n=1 Tax=Penicillium canariense TaxID=189055 RepID=A0A9W9I9G2_9EURO|nr:Meiotically protein [Penicillium canariense]KAJ5169111.1 Meiotically protein [Penicillium canariense]
MSQAEVPRAESIDEQERAHADGDKKPKSRRPANTAFRQQRLKAWQPILTPKSVLPLFFIVGVLFAPIGGVLLWASSQVQELVIDYTDCATSAPENTKADISSRVSATFKASTASSKYLWQRSNTTDNQTVCSLYFTIPESMGPPVFLYYRLTNFYQNHRRYVQSLDLDQLKGTAVPNGTISGSVCDPLATDDATGKAYYPCGLIANSMFNDSIGNPIRTASTSTNYTMTTKGIAWDSDKALIKQTKYKPWEVVPPPNWSEYNGTYEKTGIPNLHEREDFMVWMRTAGLPSFSKLARRNDDTAMPQGDYQLDILDRFPVAEYDGTKSILLSTRTVIGGKNPFMGIAYVVVGGVCVLLGALFTVAYLVRPRKLGDHTYLTWDSTNQPSTATASGRDDRLRPNAP